MIEKCPTILLVEDNPDDIELTRLALERCGVANRLEVAMDGAEALDYLFGTGAHEGRDVTDRPAVVLLDIKLPKIDGIEVLRRIRDDERTRLVPVVMLTSSKFDKELIETYGLGANSYMRKPVEFEQFIDTVRQLGFYWLLINESPYPSS